MKTSDLIFFSPIVPIGGVPMEKLAAYSSSKAALTMFSAVMRQELSKWGVKVSVIQPGGFRTSRCLTPRALQYSFWKGCWRSFVLTEFKTNPSVVDQRGVGMGGLLLSIEGQVPGFAVYGCSPAAFHQGIKFWCYVFFQTQPPPLWRTWPTSFYLGRRWPSSPLRSLNFWTLSGCRWPPWLSP